MLWLVRAARQAPRADNRTRHGLGVELQFDARAFQLIEDGAKGLLASDRKWKFPQFFRQRVARIVAQAGDFADAFLVNGERFQDIVHLAGFEIEPRRFARGQTAGACEIADTVLKKHYLADRKIG